MWVPREIKKIIDPIACTKKYFIVLSFEFIVMGLTIIKINLKRFISIPIQIDIQELEEIVNKIDNEI